MSIMFNVNEEKKSLIENTAEEIVEKVSKGEGFNCTHIFYNITKIL